VKNVLVSGRFDDLRGRDYRFLHEASRLGSVEVALWSDELAAARGRPCKFPLAERRYLLESIRFVDRVTAVAAPSDLDRLPDGLARPPEVWVVPAPADNETRRDEGRRHGLEYRVLADADLGGYPDLAPAGGGGRARRVMVTGCYDWFHSGHVRFFEEVSALGELIVVLGSDANLRLLKGEGHPMFPAVERRYVVQAIRFVSQAVVPTRSSRLDAQPEIRRLRPDIYAVNEDGDKPEKRRYCEAHGIEYKVLKRIPKDGLPRRQSTDLRGF
jgi:cytidyltransferase-like protein